MFYFVLHLFPQIIFRTVSDLYELFCCDHLQMIRLISIKDKITFSKLFLTFLLFVFYSHKLIDKKEYWFSMVQKIFHDRGVER